MSKTMMKVLNIIIIICVCLSWGCSEGAQEREVDSHTIQLSSRFPSSPSSCVVSTKAPNTKSSLHVVHKHGPCSGNTESQDEDDIFRRDQERVNSIHSKFSRTFTNRVKPSQSTDLPANQGIAIGTSNYIVKIGIGTPKHVMSLIFDTGSSLSWIQCEPCTGSCYQQEEPVFNPSSSSSFSSVACPSPVCDSLKSTGHASGCLASNCGYQIRYGDNSTTQGFLAKERFTLTPSDVFDDVNFGCGNDNQGLFGRAAGLLGLGRDKFSLPSQTTTTYNNIFSYCLPSSGSSTGHLTFGSAGISSSVKFTPFSKISERSSFYGIDIVGISVDGKKLEIPLTVFSTPGGIIDSGTVITRLPPKAYEALRTAFKEKMSSYKNTSGRSLFDTCYDFTGLDLATVQIPKISFEFSGGTVVDLGSVGVLRGSVISRCLAFAANSDDRKLAIYGNVQQKTMEVVYDGPGKRIGFAPNVCS